MFQLMNLIPQFLSILVLLMVVYFIYAVIGVQILSGKFDAILQNNAPVNNFNTVGNALVTLYLVCCSS